MTTFDSHANLAYSAVVTAPSPATTGTSLTVTTGQGVRFPASGSFNCTVWPGGGATASPANAEIVRVTAVATDTLTIVRGQEGTTAVAIATGYQIALTGTAKELTDIEAAINATLGGSLSGTLPNPTIAAGAVGTTQLASGAVGTTQIAAGAVTQRVPNNQTGLTNTSTSATFVDVDAVKVAVTVVTTGGDLEVTWVFGVQDNTTASNIFSVALSLDGATEVTNFGMRGPFAGFGTVVTLTYLWTGLAAASHTVKGRWKINGGDTIAAGGNSFMTAVEYKR